MKDQEKKKTGLGKEIPTITGIIILVAFLLFCLMGANGYYYFAYQQDKKSAQESAQPQEKATEKKPEETKDNNAMASDFGTATCPTTLTAAEVTELATWQKKVNTDFGFTYYIPGDWTVYTPPTFEGVPEEFYYQDSDYNIGFQSLEYLLDWKAGAIYHAYTVQTTTNLQVACNAATLKSSRVPGEPTLNLMEVNFTGQGKKHQIFYFYKSTGSASLDSDFGEQFKLFLKTIEFE